MLRRAEDDLWVALADGEYAGLVASTPDGFRVHDRYTRPIAVAPTLAHATRLLASPHAGQADTRRARPSTGRHRADRRPRSSGPAASTKEDTMTSGTVKWFNADKGFGFIAPTDGTPDVFAHYSEIASSGFRTLEENQAVTFDVVQGPKGPQASNIHLA